MTESLTEDDIPVLRNAFLQFLLQVPATVLIFTQVRNIRYQILQTSASETVDYEESIGFCMQSNEIDQLTLTVDVAPLVFGTMQPIHLAVSTISTAIHTQAIT